MACDVFLLAFIDFIQAYALTLKPSLSRLLQATISIISPVLH